MKTLLVLAAAVPLASATPLERTHYDGMPPARYQAEGAALVLFVDDVRPYCNVPVAEGYTLIACAGERDGVPIIVMPHPAYAASLGDPYAVVMWHELAHTQGWSGSHPE